MALGAFGFYGTIENQLDETHGIVNVAWLSASFWSGPEHRFQQAAATDLPLCWDFQRELFEDDGGFWPVKDELRPDARGRVLAAINRLKESGAWDRVIWVTVVDEPNLPEHAIPTALPQAISLLRELCPGKKIAMMYQAKKKTLWCIDQVDVVCVDRYQDGDRNLWDWWPEWMWWLKQWGWFGWLDRKLRPDQELLLCIGARSDLKIANVHKHVAWARKRERRVHVLGFVWRQSADLRGVADMPAVLAEWTLAGRDAVNRDDGEWKR